MILVCAHNTLASNSLRATEEERMSSMSTNNDKMLEYFLLSNVTVKGFGHSECGALTGFEMWNPPKKLDDHGLIKQPT